MFPRAGYPSYLSTAKADRSRPSSITHVRLYYSAHGASDRMLIKSDNEKRALCMTLSLQLGSFYSTIFTSCVCWGAVALGKGRCRWELVWTYGNDIFYIELVSWRIVNTELRTHLGQKQFTSATLVQFSCAIDSSKQFATKNPR
ncbi:hypothetical protein IW262DRAFT_1477680 [Armillaria fumosa]|nr:hypothetical protein IW262DRAFT_1477680 [Armillaria fumosa]